MPDTPIPEQIVRTAGGPKSYENDGEKIVQHSLPELVEADKYLRKAAAAPNPFRALKIARISTQGPQP